MWNNPSREPENTLFPLLFYHKFSRLSKDYSEYSVFFAIGRAQDREKGVETEWIRQSRLSLWTMF